MKMILFSLAATLFIALQAIAQNHETPYKLKAYPESGEPKSYIIEGFANASGNPQKVHIPAKVGTIPIVGIATDAFKNDTRITEVNIEDGVRNIGAGAFDGCSKLTTVRFPKTLKTIGNYAFRNCSSLSGAIKLPDGITGWGGSSFSGCSSLEKFEAPSGYHIIPNNAFRNCKNLKEVYILTILKDKYTAEAKPVALANSEVFYGCHRSLKIFVPAEMADRYKADAKWSGYSAIIVPASK